MTSFNHVLRTVVLMDTKQAVRSMDQLEAKSLRTGAGMERSLDRIGNKMLGVGAATTTGAGAATVGMFRAANAAAQFADAMQASDQILGKSLNGSIQTWANGAAQGLGLSKTAAAEALVSFAAFGKTAGLEGAELQRFSERVVKLGVDIASLRGVSNEQALGAISSGFAGETEPLKRLAIVLNEQTKKAEAVRLKLRDIADKSVLSPREQVLATASLIERSEIGVGAAGDFQRTIDTLPNRMKQARAEMENLKAAVGEGAAPVFASAIGTTAGFAKALNEIPEGARSAAGSVASVAAIGGTLVGATTIVGGAVAKVSSHLSTMGQRFTEIRSKSTGLNGITSGLAGALTGLNPAALGVTAAFATGVGVFEAWSSAAAEATDDIASTTAALAALQTASLVLPTLNAELNMKLGEDGTAAEAFDKTALSLSEVTRLVNAAPGAFDKFKDAVDGTFGSLHAIDNWGASGFLNDGADILGMGFTEDEALADLQRAAKAASPEVGRLVGSLTELYESKRISGDELRTLVEEFAKLDRSAAQSARSSASAAKQIVHQASGWRDVTGAVAAYRRATKGASVEVRLQGLIDLKTLLPDAAKAAGFADQSFEGLGESARQMSGSLAGAESGLLRFATAARDAADAANDAADGGASFADQYSAAATAVDGMVRPALNYEKALIGVERARLKLAEIDDPTGRQERLADSLDKVTDAQHNLTDSMLRRRKAQEELDKLTKRSTLAGSVPLIAAITKTADGLLQRMRAQADDIRRRFGAGSAEDIAAQAATADTDVQRSSSFDLLNKALGEQARFNNTDVASAQREVSDADRSIAKALRDRSRAERDYSEVLNGTGKDALDRREAVLGLVDAQTDLDKAQLIYFGTVRDGLDPMAQLATYLGATGIAAQTGADAFGSLNTAITTALPSVLQFIAALDGGTQPGPVREGKDGTRPYSPTPTKPGPVDGRDANPPRKAAQAPYAGRERLSATEATKLGARGDKPFTDTWGREWHYTPSGGWAIVPRTQLPGWSYTGTGTSFPAGNIADAVKGAARNAITRAGFATGGPVPGHGTGDTVPAMLTPGEFVLTRGTVQRLGVGALHALNAGRAGVQRFAQGGLVLGHNRPTLRTAARSASRETPTINQTVNVTVERPDEVPTVTAQRLRTTAWQMGLA